MTKTCTKCGETKSLDEFHKNKRCKHGRQPQCKVCMTEYTKKYYYANREARVENSRTYRKAHREEIAVYRKTYYQANKTAATKSRRDRYRFDPAFRILDNCRSRLRAALDGTSKSESTMELIGCDRDHLKFHIEQQFTEGMTWDNHGHDGWHLDHIQPCASFDLTDPEQQKTCFHYTNLQPLWAEMNLKKSDHAPDEHQIKLI